MVRQLINHLIILITIYGFANAQEYLGAELRTKESFLYGRFEARFKSAQGDGLVSSFFTYHDEGGSNWNEIDFEVLGRWNEIVNMNTITSGQSSHLRESFIKGLNPHSDYHDYAFEWTPNYVAWFVDDIEYYRQELPKHSYIATLNKSQKIMMNIWVPVYEDWVGKWNEIILPRFAYYDHVAYYEYVPGEGNVGTGNNFKLKWKDNFDSFDSNRWGKATHTFSGNRVKFDPQNIVYKDGKMILCLTNASYPGFQDLIPSKALYGYSYHNRITIRFSEEMNPSSVLDKSNYTINNVQINNIELDPDQRTIYLYVNGLANNTKHRIALNNMKDSFDNVSTLQILSIERSIPLSIPLKINVGGDKVGEFKADKFWWYDSDNYGHLNGNHQDIGNIPISNTTNDLVYRSSAERLALYKVRIQPGIYDITLMMSDNHYTAGERSFSIRLEGEIKESNLDVSSEVGKFTALEKTFKYVPVIDGVLDIHFECDLYGNGYEAAGPFLNGLSIVQTKGLGVKNIEAPKLFNLGDLYPNPFNGYINIPIYTEISMNATIDIIDLQGKSVDVLIDNKPLYKGQNIQWNGNNFSSGIYFVRMQTEKDIQLKKMCLIK